MLDGFYYLYLGYLPTQDKSTIGYVERHSDNIYAQIYTLYTLYPTNAVKKIIFSGMARLLILIQIASGLTVGPTHQSVGNITRITMSS